MCPSATYTRGNCGPCAVHVRSNCGPCPGEGGPGKAAQVCIMVYTCVHRMAKDLKQGKGEAEPSRFIVLATQTQTFKTYTRGGHQIAPEQNAEAAAILRSQTVFAVRLAGNGWSTVRCAQRRLWLAGHTSNTGYSLACELAETFQAHSTALLQTDRLAMLLLSI